LACIYPDQAKLDPSFLSEWLNSPRARRYSDTVAIGNAQKTVTLGALAKFPVPVFPLGVQQEVVGRLSLQDELIAAQRAEISKIQVMRRGLMGDLLVGSFGFCGTVGEF
jgi:type I restriction enzyme S subunit